MHSRYSDGLSSVEEILRRAKELQLDLIALTDHDTMDGVEEALSLSSRYGVGVIPGCEISTQEGHLVALFLKHPVQKGLPLVDTLCLLREQKAVAFAPHLFARRLLDGMKPETIAALLSAQDSFRDVFLGVEVYGGGNLLMRPYTPRAAALADRHGLAQIGSSDSHQRATVGQYVTHFKGRSAEDLLQAMLHHQTRGVEHNFVPAWQIWAGFGLLKVVPSPYRKGWVRVADAIAWKAHTLTRGTVPATLSRASRQYQDHEA